MVMIIELRVVFQTQNSPGQTFILPSSIVPGDSRPQVCQSGQEVFG